MNASFPQVMILLFAGIAIIVILTARFRVHAFFALLLACFVVGIGIQLPIADIISITKDGFGSIMKNLGLIIVLGTALGVILQHTGSTQVMANFILRITGKQRAALAMSITGFIVGLPIFCDSGFIVLSGLNKSMAKKTGISIVVMSVSLATGLYAVHCLLPPHPGAAAAASVIGVEYGKLIMIGMVCAFPAMLVGHWWANYAGKKVAVTVVPDEADEQLNDDGPAVLTAFLPVLVPIFLIAIRPLLLTGNGTNAFLQKLLFLSDPVIALSIGVILSFMGIRKWTSYNIGSLLTEAAEKAGGILVIIGAGGAFGAILSAAKIGNHFSEVVALGSMGILFPFLLTAILKTAQGSSTVAIITAATIVQPLLPSLGLDSANGKLLCVLSMGAGSMLLSHANDAYFWVIAKFSGLDIRSMLKVYTIATALMSIVTLLMLYLVSLFL